MTFIFLLMAHELSYSKEIERRRFPMQTTGEIFTECKYFEMT